MLAAAFNEVVRRIRVRVTAACFGPDARANIAAVLLRAAAARRQACRRSPDPAGLRRSGGDLAGACHDPADRLTEVTEALTEAFRRAAAASAPAEQCRLAARVALAAADGLALHAVSSKGWILASQLTAELALVLNVLVPGRHER